MSDVYSLVDQRERYIEYCSGLAENALTNLKATIVSIHYWKRICDTSTLPNTKAQAQVHCDINHDAAQTWMNTYQFWSDNVTHARNALKAERDKIDQLIPQMDLNAELDAMDS